MKHKECNFRAVKSVREGSWSLSHFETLKEAQNWITPCDKYCILNKDQEVIDMKNWDLARDQGIWTQPSEEEVNVKSEKVVPFNGQ